MNLIKRLLLPVSQNNKKKVKNENSLLQEIIQFADNVKKEFHLEDVKFEFDETLQINKGSANTNSAPYIVTIGVKECSEHKDLSESQWITIKNTIMHELQHMKNHVELKKSTVNKLVENKYSLAYYAFYLVDEYSAYKTADDKFKVNTSGSKEEKLQKAFKQLWAEEGLFERYGYSDKERFGQIYDIVTAIIVHGIRNEEFPSIPEAYQGYNDMCKKIKEIVIKYSSLMPLDYNHYEVAGQELWNALLLAVPQNKYIDFKKNLGIRF